MDPVSISASIIAVIQLSSEVVKYISDVSGATKERIRLRDEVLCCESILQQLRDGSDDSEEAKWSETINSLETPNGPLNRLSVILDLLRSKLQPRDGFEKAFGALKWPFQEKEVSKMINTMEREKNLLNLALANDSRKLMQRIKGSAAIHEQLLTELIQVVEQSSKDAMDQFSNLADSLIHIRRSQSHLESDVGRIHDRQDGRESAEEQRAVFAWLTPTEYLHQHCDFINRREAGTGQWLLNSEEYQRWIVTDKETLFCPGIPGAGKTILTSIVIDDLTTRFHDNRDIGVAYIYCNFQRQDDQTAPNLLASLLKQLGQQRPSLPDEVKNLYNKYKNKQSRLSFKEISETLRSMIALYHRAFVIVDALDEYRTSDRMKFLAEIFDIQAKTHLNVFATSRSIPEISERFKDAISLEVCASEEDVRRYVEGHMFRLPSFVDRNQKLQEEIKTGISQSVGGMFLLAQLFLDSLIGKRSPKAVRSALAQLPTGSGAYNSAFENAMERIEGQVKDQEDLAKQVLSWIICAKRPLTTSELRYALAVEIGRHELDEDNLPDIDDIVSVCAGLVTVSREGGIIRLVHYTMQEFFLNTQSRWLPNAEVQVATTCITYLSLNTFGEGFCETDDLFEERLQSNQLYEYAAQNWGHHARVAHIEVENLVLDFLQTESKVLGSSQAMMATQDYRYHGYSQDVPRQITGVHLAAYFGLRDTVEALLKNGYEPDSNDTHRRTPLSYAAERGHETVVELLLDNNSVNPDSKDSRRDRTPLWYAVAKGHTSVVKLLLEKGRADPNYKSKHKRVMLSLAAEKGYEKIVALLLKKDQVDPDHIDSKQGRTPLLWAAANGHHVVVKRLLDTARVNPNSKEFEYGRTPLSWAAERGHNEVVEVLLADNRIDPNSMSKSGRTPSWFARERGHKTIVDLLRADNRINPEPGYSLHDQVPLWYAAETGQELKVKLLLRDRINPDSVSTYGRTPLSYAAERGHEAIFRLLFEKDGVNPDSKDPAYGRTPLSWAAAGGHEAIVRLLLEDNRVSPDSNSKMGLTPLSWAARFGHVTVVDLLLATKKVDPDSKSDSGRTPLSYAAERGHQAVVRMLLKRSDVNPSSKDFEHERTPLSWAIMKGHHAVVELLRKGSTN
ncbi:ankyrin repeat-containing domain protein [Rostrohypoxylon terebratum]|nr:ankyrin repeat-containing domain protein [Rostrohypoxylon terebratum]